MVVDDEWLNENSGKYKCPFCKKEYSKKGISTHIMRSHSEKDRFKNSGTSGKTWKMPDGYVPFTLINKKVIPLTRCEKCGKMPKEVYASGRFCSRSCSNSRTKPEKVRKKISKTLSGRVFDSRTNSYIKEDLCKISFCKNCKKCFENNRRIFCSDKCRDFYKIKDYSDLEIYRNKTKFNFSLNDFPDKFDFSLIEKFGWYKAKNRGDNQNGITRDHIISVRYGFDNNIPTWIISHPANCQLKRHLENVSKGMKCDLTLDELLEKINSWKEMN